MKKAYFIGIAGGAPSSIAKALRDIGWEVGGSEHENPYPPASVYLEENQINYFKGYRKENVPADADIVVVGRGALIHDKENEEFKRAKELNLKIYSMPQVLEKFVIKENSVVVAGTFGKTTTTALVSWIFIKAGLNPSYMIGGKLINFRDNVKITDSDYSVTEGDEAPALLETDQPKFKFYEPKYLLLTATYWDHPEVYKTEEAYLNTFIDLVRFLPKDGLLVYNLDNVNQEVVRGAQCRKISYSFQNKKADYFIRSYSHQKNGINFELNNGFRSEAILLGKTNLENICGAVALCLELGIKKEIVVKSVTTFKGVKVRLEFLGELQGRFIYWDFAQHPEKVKGSLEALREHYKENRIICVFDPVTTGLKYKESLQWYSGTFDKADEVIVVKVGYLKGVKGKDRVTGADIVKAISKTQKRVFYQPVEEKIFSYLIGETKPKDVIVFMSSGGLRFTNLIAKVVDSFKKIGKKGI